MTAAPLCPLVARSLARGARVFAAVAAILTGFQVLLVLVATTFQETRSFELLTGLMPMSVQQSFGPGALMLASFAGMVTFGYFHPIVVLAVIQVGVYAATEPAGEVEWGLFDLELARPVRRCAIVARSLLVALGVTTATVAAMAAGTWGGLWLFAPAGAKWPDPLPRAEPGRAPADAVVGVRRGRPGRGGVRAPARMRPSARCWWRRSSSTCMNFVADAWKPAAALRPYTPFHYYPGLAVANGTAPVALRPRRPRRGSRRR